MANFGGLLHHKFHHHAPKNEAFEGCNHFIISGGSKVPEVDNLWAQRGHLGVYGVSIEFWLTIHHWKHKT